MFRRCPNCDGHNNPEYRFCGMCGAALTAQPPGAVGAGAPVFSNEPVSTGSSASDPDCAPSVAGPSFLGLAEPSRDPIYLLEDEPSSRRWLVYLVVVLLLVGGAVLAWRWRSEGYAWRTVMANHRLLGNAENQKDATAVASETEPKVETSESGPGVADSVQPKATGQQPPLAGQATADNVSPAPPPTAAAVPTERAPSPKRAESAPQSENSEIPAAAQRQSDLVAEGKSYLYGSGGPRDCARARASLLAAAEQEDAQAQTVLGAMFATGHCVPVDLPTAYRWLARAQRRDPANPLVASNMRTVWNEMTAEQQQAATRSLH
jgi:hypothetical protein